VTSVQAADKPSRRDTYSVIGLGILLAALGGLFYYKWGGAFRTLAKVRAAGAWTATADALTSGGVIHQTMFYFHRIWIALLYGLLIGSAVCAFVSPRRLVGFLSGGHPIRRQIAGGLVGAPLMLCSCCITPVFQSVYEGGAELGSALSLMLASPGLNPAALVLTFLLFPPALGAARLAAALLLVFAVPPILARTVGAGVRAPRRALDASADDAPPTSARNAVVRFGASFVTLTIRTVPLILGGVLVSSLLLPASVNLSGGGTVVAVAGVATLAVLVAVPTFFELPIAIVLVKAGLPGAAAAMLIAGPIVNLPSLLIVARETRPRVALALGLAVWAVAVTVGLAI